MDEGRASEPLEGQRCARCGRHSRLIASELGLCVDCVRRKPAAGWPRVLEVHARARAEFGALPNPPRAEKGVDCQLCAQSCQIGEGEIGYCGLRTVQDGRLRHLAGMPGCGLLHWYRDPLPTNCVAMNDCSGRDRQGQHNLAVFYGSCTLNCLYCQNWHYRDLLPDLREIRAGALSPGRGISAVELAAAADQHTYCVCYFGGDPASQMPHALASATIMARRGITVCWETNGMAHPRLMDSAVSLSLNTGGTVKFDLKAFDEGLHYALTGASNQRILENLTRAAQWMRERPEPPLLMASTTLVPGYVDTEEVRSLARFIADLNPDIPYALLGFAPHFYLFDLPSTSRRHAAEAEAAARSTGLHRVRIGNRHLLSTDY